MSPKTIEFFFLYLKLFVLSMSVVALNINYNKVMQIMAKLNISVGMHTQKINKIIMKIRQKPAKTNQKTKNYNDKETT